MGRHIFKWVSRVYFKLCEFNPNTTRLEFVLSGRVIYVFHVTNKQPQPANFVYGLSRVIVSGRKLPPLILEYYVKIALYPRPIIRLTSLWTRREYALYK